ncbi:MAG: ABC transporter ATP-binding protein [Gammaproteobacteria bacterium]|nr:ABC transporter ATP-binding protein [Gammaproteobacteria bacterium]
MIEQQPPGETQGNNIPDCLLEARQLWRDYDGHVAVRDLDLELRRGDVLGFLGPNGAGKSTTMQMLSGNLAPSTGSIRINGIDLLDEPAAAKRQLGYLPEQPPLYPELTVSEYLDFCARLHGVARSERGRAIEAAIERCDLGDMRNRLIGQLSKGYQQRTGIAQAILHDPAVIILDEPTVGLDPIQIRDIRALIRELGRDHALLLSTHILAEVQETCSRVLMIHHGRVVHESRLDALDAGVQYRISGSTLPDDGTFRSLAGVAAVERVSPERVILTLDSEPPRVLAQLAAKEWGISEFTPQHRNLEQLFVELTARDTEGAA